MPITTWRPIDRSLAWFEHFALPVLGLAGPGLMTPCPVKAEYTAIRGCDDRGPLVDWLTDEGLAIRQARVVIGTRGYVGPCARWTLLLHRLFDLSRDKSRFDAV